MRRKKRLEGLAMGPSANGSMAMAWVVPLITHDSSLEKHMVTWMAWFSWLTMSFPNTKQVVFHYDSRECMSLALVVIR